MLAWARLGLIAMLAGVAAPPAPADAPQEGDPCPALHSYPVTFTADPGAAGAVRASFDFAGGAAHGSLPLDSRAATLAAADAAYVTDVQLGTYELYDSGAAPACRLAATYHFFCPGTGSLDEFCYTWVSPLPRAARR